MRGAEVSREIAEAAFARSVGDQTEARDFPRHCTARKPTTQLWWLRVGLVIVACKRALAGAVAARLRDRLAFVLAFARNHG